MALLLLVRHGHTPTAGKVLTGWERGIHLTAQGREQADALARRLEEVPIDAIYSSPLERCRETAAPLSRTRGVATQVHRGLIETGYGEWTGRSIRQLTRTRLWRTLQRTPSAIRFPGGETLRDVQARALDAVETITDSHPRGTVVVVTHADVVRLLLAHFAGVHIDLFERFVVEPASVSAVALDEGRAAILKVNDTGDLGSLAPRPRPRAQRRRSAARKVEG